MQKLIKIIRSNFFPFLCSSTIMGSAFLGYMSYKIHNNKTNFQKLSEDDKFKDTTRLSYDFYGLNWGVASDNMVFLYILLKKKNFNR